MRRCCALAFARAFTYDGSMTAETFHALVIRETENGVGRAVETRRVDDLPPGDLLIRVQYSSLNYKDALSANGNRGVTRKYPHTPGVDAAGIVVESRDPAFHPGDAVVAGGYDMGMNTAGGFGQYIRVPAGWALPLPAGISAKEAMQLGAAGFTAALIVYRLEAAGLRPELGEVLVTGATGGVGSLSVLLMSQLGYRLVAATGKLDQADFLRSIGAADVIDRRILEEGTDRALLRQRWTAVVDTVGGTPLASAIKATRANGWVAACGNAASGDLNLTVYPFILRGVSLLGIDAANCPLELRRTLWQRLGHAWRMENLDRVTTLTDLDGIGTYIDNMLVGQVTGRVVVDLWPGPAPK
jgi:putative YhdH/YhfP family quinone oxidoreductase